MWKFHIVTYTHTYRNSVCYTNTYTHTDGCTVFTTRPQTNPNPLNDDNDGCIEWVWEPVSKMSIYRNGPVRIRCYFLVVGFVQNDPKLWWMFSMNNFVCVLFLLLLSITYDVSIDYRSAKSLTYKHKNIHRHTQFTLIYWHRHSYTNKHISFYLYLSVYI